MVPVVIVLTPHFGQSIFSAGVVDNRDNLARKVPIPMTYSEKIAAAPAGSLHHLEPEKAKRLGGQTMYVPSVADVLAAIREIPIGETRTNHQLRQRLAKIGNADTACPFQTNRYWKWLAFACEEEGGEQLPWWRVLKNGKLHDSFPGGPDHQRKLLLSDGVTF